MRFFLAFSVVLCAIGGVWLWQLPDFYWPARNNPALALHLDSTGTRLLSAGLIATAALGLMAILNARRPATRRARSTQYTYFALAMTALALITSAILHGETLPNPESARNHPIQQNPHTAQE